MDVSRYSDLDAYLIHEEFGINVIRPAFCKSSPEVTETPIPVTKTPRKSKAKPEVISLPLPGIPRRRGRPVSANPLSNAERQRKHREKRAQELKAKLESASESFASETEADLLKWLVEAGPKLQEKAWLELGRRKGWKLP